MKSLVFFFRGGGGGGGWGQKIGVCIILTPFCVSIAS